MMRRTGENWREKRINMIKRYYMHVLVRVLVQ